MAGAATADAAIGVTIERFDRTMQDEFRRLVLDGMTEHWGRLDDSLNRDLDDIEASYRDDIVLVAVESDQLVGTGIVVLEPPTGRIVRMSVQRDHRRRGIAASLSAALSDMARASGVEKLILETEARWQAARALYESVGFVFTRYEPGTFGRKACYAKQLTQPV